MGRGNQHGGDGYDDLQNLLEPSTNYRSNELA